MAKANSVKQEFAVDTVSSSYSKQCNDYEETETKTISTTIPVRASKRKVVATANEFSSETQTKRPRGRPPKTEPTVISPSEYKRLSPSDRKYIEMRLKNNEASRRSRLNRKGKEEAIFEEFNALLAKNEYLKESDRKMDIEIRKWRRGLMKLAHM